MAGEINISLLGHKDHGKSTLIGSILMGTGSMTEGRISEARGICRSLGREFEPAFLLDSFVEEREGGFTLDTTTAQARHNGFIYNLIDVPGHKELVRNMISGASMADAAILIVSAKEDEGLQDETRLHIYLARFLGISRIVVVVNKMDAAGYSQGRFEQIRAGMLRLLGSFGFRTEDIEFIPVSAREGDNVVRRSGAMPWHSGRCVLECLEGFASGSQDYMRLPARMFIQDVYDVGGNSIAVGRVECGIFRVGDAVAIEPGGIRAVIGALSAGDGKSMAEAAAGQNTGLALEGGRSLARGSLCMDGKRAAQAAQSFRARVFCLPGSALGIGERLEMICGPQTAACRLVRVLEIMHPINDSAPRRGAGAAGIGASESAEAEIETESPVVLERFADVPPTGRFVIWKSGRVAAVGVVL
jgi:translation elongation factor EF-1alpha